MVLPLYLAMTREEFHGCSQLPALSAWMACHFSPYGTGLTGLPPALPVDAMVILNDRVPIAGHDPEYIREQLRHLRFSCLLLDFQRPCEPETAALTAYLTERLSCPVGVSQSYAQGLDCPVFLPPVPPDTPPEDWLTPWKGQEIWLEAATDGMRYRVTKDGAQSYPLPSFPDTGQKDEALCCHYRVSLADDHADFALWRTRQDLDELLDEAKARGVTKAVGLWQELG